MYRVRSYPFVFIENRVGKMVVIIASVMMQPYLAVTEAMAELPPMATAGSGRCYGVSLRQTEQPVVNAGKRYIASCANIICCWKENRTAPLAQQAHMGRVTSLARSTGRRVLRWFLSFAAITAKTAVTLPLGGLPR